MRPKKKMLNLLGGIRLLFFSLGWCFLSPRTSFAAYGASAASDPSIASSLPAGTHSAPENNRSMEASASRSSRGFEEEDEDDRDFARREGSSFHKADLTVKVDGKGSGTDDLPATPRSKHSAMEQRRRNKINDRFQILRELIPHGDQKRDKASFLLEAIEYIRFLQEKVQKYESPYPGSNQENSKLMPWVKVYYRSFWKNAQHNSQIPVDGLSDPQVIRDSSTPAFSEQFDEGSIPAGPAMISNIQNPTESDTTAGIPYKMENATGFVNNMSSQPLSHWLGSSSPANCAGSGEMLNGQEDLIIDEGTINASATYSQGLLTTLTQALQSSGVDLSQASIAVQINLGKRASFKRPAATASLCNSKGSDNPSSNNQAVDNNMIADNIDESSHASKRRNMDFS